MRTHVLVVAILIAAITAMSTVAMISIAETTQVNWNTNANFGLNWNYVNQSVINSDTITKLGLQWAFPTPAAPNPYAGHEGVCCTPLIENGITYMLTNYHHLYALNLATGAILWQVQLSVNVSNKQIFFPYNNVGPAGHYHNSNIFYSTHTLGRPLIWVITDNYTVDAYDANIGTLVLSFTPKIPDHGQDGNLGYYDDVTPSGFLDDQRGILVIGTSGSEGTDSGRGFLIAYNVNQNPPALMWMTPIIPPQDGSDPNWDLQQVQSMVGAWIFNGTGAVNLKALPTSVLNATLYDDWGFAKYSNKTNSFAGADLAWGGPWSENYTNGLLYVSTAEAAPDWNATFRPGPNLWADSILAVNIQTGQLVWGFQTWPHDLEDYDCSWAAVLTTAQINGATHGVLVKGCKNGYVYGLDPATGALLWYFNPPNIVRVNTPPLNPLSSSDMHKPYFCYPKPSPCIQNPSGTGGIESDPAYDPQTGLVYFGTYNSPSNYTIQAVSPTPGVPYGSWGLTFGPAMSYNATIWAINVANGKGVWSYNVPNVGFRGGLTTTDNLLLVPLINGYLNILNAANGSVISQQLIGGPLEEQPSIGTDTNGHMVIVQPVGSDNLGIFSAVVPGDVIALTPLVTQPTTVVTTTQGISPILFYSVVVIAVILAIALGTVGRRRSKVTQT
jgi:alcohol dehydrogenase (cytochrome c)